jgi:hypothetical protein
MGLGQGELHRDDERKEKSFFKNQHEGLLTPRWFSWIGAFLKNSKQQS